MTDAVEMEKRRRIILSAEDRWQTRGLSREGAAAVRDRWRREIHRLRGEAQLLDTIDTLAACGIGQELGERGWSKDWPAVPSEARALGGRWPGSRTGGYPESIPLRLPSDLAERVLAACWHTSVESIRKIRKWRDTYPDVVPVAAAPAAAELAGLPDPLAEYERLAAQVTTVGVVYRAGITRGIKAAEALAAAHAPDADSDEDPGPS
ncbi:hypothetical protein [Streptomyces sp. WM6378]|uniref:hypothetical protein n=1 Tax=Streptomyces sp. WM6378 TaxID=1415557 RepID=UPI00131C2CF7|nr:hypothetical protein [Streptomyces sp. WM6378]